MIYNEKRDLFGNVEVQSVNEETGKISKLKFKPEIIKIESFSQSGLFYEIDKNNQTCSCPAFQNRPKKFCKHLQKIMGLETIGESTLIPLSLLKSLIQKAVRRNQPNIAVKAAKLMMEIDKTQFFRRWLVIIIEDGILHPNFSEIASFLKTNKPLTKEDKDLILNCVYEVADSKQRDVWVTRDRPYIDEEGNKVVERGMESLSKIINLDVPTQTLLSGLKFRASIGGMKGDVVMLNNYYYLWVDRFVNKNWTIQKLNSFFTKQNIDSEKVEILSKKDIIPEAADFHCTPLLRIMMKKDYFLNEIQSTYPEEADLDIERVAKGILWRTMSCINFKTIINNGGFIQDVWYRCEYGERFNKEKDQIFFNKFKLEIYRVMEWYLNKNVKLK